jgi:hypothetical protein
MFTFSECHYLIEELQDADSTRNKQTKTGIIESPEWKYIATPSG